MRNIFIHLYHGKVELNELVMLATKPEWIGSQFSANGLLQYESDVSYVCK